MSNDYKPDFWEIHAKQHQACLALIRNGAGKSFEKSACY